MKSQTSGKKIPNLLTRWILTVRKSQRLTLFPPLLLITQLATINSLSKTDLISTLCSALSLLENQLLNISELELTISRLSVDNVSVLESKVARLSSDLVIQEDQVKCLKDEAAQMKVSFADCVLKLQQASSPVKPGHLFLVRRMPQLPVTTPLVQF